MLYQVPFLKPGRFRSMPTGFLGVLLPVQVLDPVKPVARLVVIATAWPNRYWAGSDQLGKCFDLPGSHRPVARLSLIEIGEVSGDHHRIGPRLPRDGLQEKRQRFPTLSEVLALLDETAVEPCQVADVRCPRCGRESAPELAAARRRHGSASRRRARRTARPRGAGRGFG